MIGVGWGGAAAFCLLLELNYSNPATRITSVGYHLNHKISLVLVDVPPISTNYELKPVGSKEPRRKPPDPDLTQPRPRPREHTFTLQDL